MGRVLLVDDDEGFGKSTAEFIELHGHTVQRARTLTEARKALAEPPDLLLIDLMLPDGSGLELLESLNAGTRAVIITGNPSINSAIRAVRGPVVDYLVKPFDGEQLRGCLERFAVGQPATVPARTVPQPRGNARFGYLIGESPQMQKIYQAIERVAPLETTVFIYGESGTGKELVARAIHDTSGREGPFVPVNCGAIAENLIASELFGHEKGSFTGAARRHIGYFERASGGTLFLDEITEMPAELQTHLLRVLETSRISRVGGDQEIDIDVRLVAATNRDPRRAVETSAFREDLYYRLMVFPIEVPPLRERPEDTEQLADHFLAALNEEHGTNRRLSGQAREQLRSYSWPGNVRELKHTLERAYILAAEDDGELVLPTDLARVRAEAPQYPGFEVGTSIRDMERALILSTLDHFNGDKKRAADTLGISLRTLYNRLESYRGEERDAC